MKTITQTCIALAAITLGGAIAQAAEPALRIYSGKRDTVTTAKQVVVAVTEPGATATINGNEVKVYNTGSFGAEVDLAPGNNTVTVKAMKDGSQAETTFNIFRKEPPAKKAKAQGARFDSDGHLIEGAETSHHDPLAAERTVTFDSPFYIESTGNGYLQYGNGDDRLGGSKMGFIDDGIVMKVDGEKGSLYRVALADGRFAFIPKEYTRPAAKGNPIVNTLSWSVSDQGKFDRISVGLPVRLPYAYSAQIDPSTIIVDIFGATDNSNWITQRSAELGMVAFVDFDQPQSDVYRVIIRLKDKYQWGYSVHYQGNNLVIDVRHRPDNIGLKGLVVGLDAGHGGPYPGARSPSGLLEKDINLDIVLKLRDMLEKAGAKVILTRDGDTGPSMTERKRIWREGGAQLTVSVHNNSGGSALSSPGTSALYKHLFDRPLAASILNRILELDVPLFGLVQNFNFSLNGPTDAPNMLVEGLFMSSLKEEELLADPDFRTRMARAIYLGIDDYLKTVKESLKK